MDAFQTQIDDIIANIGAALRAEVDADLAALRAAGGESVDGVLALLANPSSSMSIRQTAAWLLGRLDDPRAGAALLSALDDSSLPLRRQVVVELGGLRHAPAVARLLDLLATEPAVSEVVAWALGEIGDLRAQGPLLTVLADRSHPAALRGQAAESLSSIANATAALPALLSVLDDAEPEVRFNAAFAPGAIGDPSALAALARHANDAGVAPGGTVGQQAHDAADAIRVRSQRGDVPGA